MNLHDLKSKFNITTKLSKKTKVVKRPKNKEPSSPKLLRSKIKFSYMQNMHMLYSTELVTVKERYISNNNKLVNIMQKLPSDNRHQICIINSSMGTGKSTLIKQWCEGRNILVIGARITFCDMMTALLGLQNYQTTTIKPFSVFNHPRFVVQLQSIIKFEGILTPKCTITCSYDFLILDEFVSICQQLISEVSDYKTRINIAKAFTNLINVIPNVIISDAHITMHYIRFIQNCLIWSCQQDPKYFIFNNEYKPKSLDIRLYTGGMSMTPTAYLDYINRVVKKKNNSIYSINSTILKMEKKLSSRIIDSYIPYIATLGYSYRRFGSGFWKRDFGYTICKRLQTSERGISIICISQQVANFIYAALNHLYPSKNIALFTGNESINVDTHKLCDSTQNELVLKDIDALIYTNVLSIGIDFNTDECADYTFLVLPSTKYCSSITNVIQSIGRIRRIKQLYIYYDNSTLSSLENFDSRMEQLYESPELIPQQNDEPNYIMDYMSKLYTCEASLNERTDVFTDVLLEILKRDYNVDSIENHKAVNSTTALVKSDTPLKVFEKYYTDFNLDENLINKYFHINLVDLFEYMHLPKKNDVFHKIEVIIQLITLFQTPQCCWRVYKSINWERMIEHGVSSKSVTIAETSSSEYLHNFQNRTKYKLYELYTHRPRSKLSYNSFIKVFDALDSIIVESNESALCTLHNLTVSSIITPHENFDLTKLTDNCIVREFEKYCINPVELAINLDLLMYNFVCCT